MDETTTRKLMQVLRQIDSTEKMEKYLHFPKVTDSCKTFPEYFRSLPTIQHTSDTDLIRASGIEKSYYYQILKGTKSPGRDKILRLCIGAGLSLQETTRALELSGNAPLYPKRRRDIILTVLINQKASVDDANLMLYKYGEDPLK